MCFSACIAEYYPPWNTPPGFCRRGTQTWWRASIFPPVGRWSGTQNGRRDHGFKRPKRPSQSRLLQPLLMGRRECGQGTLGCCVLLVCPMFQNVEIFGQQSYDWMRELLMMVVWSQFETLMDKILQNSPFNFHILSKNLSSFLGSFLFEVCIQGCSIWKVFASLPRWTTGKGFSCKIGKSGETRIQVGRANRSFDYGWMLGIPS